MPLSRSPPSPMNPLIPASLQLVRRQNVQHDGARGRRDGGHIANKKGGPVSRPAADLASEATAIAASITRLKRTKLAPSAP
jgi:hypothetical protein